MAVLGSGVLMLSATADGFKKDLNRAGSSVDAFNKKVTAVPEIGEKINSSFGRISSAGQVFKTLDSDISGLEKTVVGAQAGISSFVVGMQVATKVATGFKAALLGTGIGAVVLGLGWLVGKLSEARAESQKEREAWQKWLDKVELPTAMTSSATAARELSLRSAAELGIEADKSASGIEEIAAAAGRTGHELAIFNLETRAATLALDPLITSSGTYARILGDIRRLRVAATTIELRREVERLRTPVELVNSELDRMTSLLHRSGDFDVFRLGIMNIIGAPEVDAVVVRVDTIVSAFRRLARERDIAMRAPDLSLPPGLDRLPPGWWTPPVDRTPGLRGALEAIGGIVRSLDVSRTVDALATLSGDRPGPLSAFSARMDAITRGAEGAREAFFRGGLVGPAPDFRRFDRGRARAFLDVERALGNFERSAPAALLEGSDEAVSAINAARRNAAETDPMRRVERVLERLERIEEAERRELEGIGGVLARGIRRV